MKTFIMIVLFLYPLKSFAQTPEPHDKIYYLLDTAKIPLNARMWNVFEDKPIKYYILECPCLELGTKPILTYNMNIEGDIVSKEKLKYLNLVTLPVLIQKAKETLNNGVRNFDNFLLVEPYGKIFKVHKVVLSSEKRIIDRVIIKPDKPGEKKKP